MSLVGFIYGVGKSLNGIDRVEYWGDSHVISMLEPWITTQGNDLNKFIT